MAGLHDLCLFVYGWIAAHPWFVVLALWVIGCVPASFGMTLFIGSCIDNRGWLLTVLGIVLSPLWPAAVPVFFTALVLASAWDFLKWNVFVPARRFWKAGSQAWSRGY